MKPRRLITLAAVTALIALALTAGSADARPSEPTASMSPAGEQAVVLPVITLALRNVVSRFLFRSLARSVPRYVVKRYVTRWVTSRGAWCPPTLPARFFCAGRPPEIRGVGLAWPVPGYSAITLHSAPSFSSPAPGWAPYGHALGLICYATGGWAGGHGGDTNLWYLLPSGWWAFDGLLYTGTTSVVPGVPRC
ncbi:MAG: hypothetical protein ACRDN6_09775 [Gaiellaceae bacterium]